MPAFGWRVKYLADGHDVNAISVRLPNPIPTGAAAPSVIVARTIMGKGISFMENLAKYHGSPLNQDLLAAALEELGMDNDFAYWQESGTAGAVDHILAPLFRLSGDRSWEPPVLYGPDTMTDNRSAYGNALQGLAEANNATVKSENRWCFL